MAHMLAEGEHTSIEFMGLVYEDVLVHGLDDAELYAVNIEEEELLVPYDYLYAIALQTMSDADYESWLDLADKGENENAFDLAMQSTDYTADALERYLNLKTPKDQQVMLKEIADKAEEVGAEIYPKEEVAMQALMDFTDIAYARGGVFAESVMDIIKKIPGRRLRSRSARGMWQGFWNCWGKQAYPMSLSARLHICWKKTPACCPGRHSSAGRKDYRPGRLIQSVHS